MHHVLVQGPNAHPQNNKSCNAEHISFAKTCWQILNPDAADVQHRRLVAYYKRMFGFRVVRELTGRLRDVPDMVVWGGLGTRMDGDLRSILQKWTAALHRELQLHENGAPE